MAHAKELAIGGFAHGNVYNSARPSYPVEAVHFLAEALGLSTTSHVLDLGAGTGIFTRQILPFVGHVTAVEPSASMRDTFRAVTPGVDVVEGTDVAIPLEDHSVEAIFAAQAFHWFDAPRCLVEMRRVLVRGGGLGLIWNERDTNAAWVRDLNTAMLWNVHQPYDAEIDFGAIVAAGPFCDVRKEVLHHSQVLTHEQLLRRTLTTSYITLMNDDERADVVGDVTAVMAPLPDPLELPYVVNVVVAFARDHD